jgi:hypothetical protein
MMLHQNMALELVVLEVAQNHLFVFVFYHQKLLTPLHREHLARAFFSFF